MKLSILALLFACISGISLQAAAAVLQVKDNDKVMGNLLLSTSSKLATCFMAENKIKECFFNINIYSCTDELRIASLDITHFSEGKNNGIKNIELAPGNLQSTVNQRLVKSFEIDRLLLVNFNRHFNLESFNKTKFKCGLVGDTEKKPINVRLECTSEGPLKLKFEELGKSVNIFDWCKKPFIID